MSEYFACIHGVHGGIDSKTPQLPDSPCVSGRTCWDGSGITAIHG